MNPSSSLRLRDSRRFVTITKPPTRFYLRRFCGMALMVAMILLPLFWEGQFMVDKIQALHEYRVVVNDFINTYSYDTHKNSSNNTNLYEYPSSHQPPSSMAIPLQPPAEDVNVTVSNVEPPKLSSSPPEPKLETSNSKKNGKIIDNTMTTTTSKTKRPRKSTKRPTVLHYPAKGDDGIEMLMELDGLNGSKAFRLILNDMNASMLFPNLIWIGSPIPHRLCHMSWVRQAMEYYHNKRANAAEATTTKIKLDWTFHLLDWDDHSDTLLRCRRLEEMVGAERVHYWKRSIVLGRHWNATTQTVELGRVSTELDGVQVRPLHLSTRTDIVQGIVAAVNRLTNNQTSTTTNMMTPAELSEYVVVKERPGDVIHHWPAFGRGVNRGSHKKRNDLLRSLTSLTLANMTLPPYNLSDVFCGMHGVAKDKGRQSTSDAYVDSILHYKIMVVTQRDVFEGHLRLFEGLVSGAMVLHDRIIAPPIGLEENVNIVYFDNQDELQDKVMYYLNHTEERLAIARRGRKLAMCQSRTWHRMEQIILGKTITPCDE